LIVDRIAAERKRRKSCSAHEVELSLPALEIMLSTEQIQAKHKNDSFFINTENGN